LSSQTTHPIKGNPATVLRSKGVVKPLVLGLDGLPFSLKSTAIGAVENHPSPSEGSTPVDGGVFRRARR
jgi:hypothetical protein